MATLQQIRTQASRLGAELDEHSPVDYGASAPCGFIFKDSGCHYLIVCGEGEPEVTPAQVRRDMLAALQLGLEPCNTPDCDYCNGDDDDEEDA